MTVEHTHEEIQLLAIDFSTMLFETTAPMPAWRDAYLSRDQRPTYAYLVKVLKALQWLRGGTRWVLKTPQHLEQFPALVHTFPDATFVVTHRDPVSVTASMVTMIAYTRPPDPRPGRPRGPMGDYWSDRLERMLRRCADERDALPADRTIDLHFDEFMADDLAMVARVYDLAGPAPGRSLPCVHGVLHGRAPPRSSRGGQLRPGPIRPRRRRAAAGPGLLHGALRGAGRGLTVPGQPSAPVWPAGLRRPTPPAGPHRSRARSSGWP